MKKYGIKSKDNNDILIFHALPNETAKFQWYISENINEKGRPINGQIYESYTLSTEVIKRKNFVGKYLYCEYLVQGLNQYEKTEYIKLDLNIDSMVNSGVIFDDISKFDEQGNIVNLRYRIFEELNKAKVDYEYIEKKLGFKEVDIYKFIHADLSNISSEFSPFFLCLYLDIPIEQIHSGYFIGFKGEEEYLGMINSKQKIMEVANIHTKAKTILYNDYTTDGEPIHSIEFDGVVADIIGDKPTKREIEIFKIGILYERERLWDESEDLVDDKIMRKLLRYK